MGFQASWAGLDVHNCDGIVKLFHRIFECETTEKFATGCTKMYYIVWHGPGFLCFMLFVVYHSSYEKTKQLFSKLLKSGFQ